MNLRTLCLLLIGVIAAHPACAFTGPIIQAEKQVITSTDQLPRRNYSLPRLPSQLLEAPSGDVEAVFAALDKDLAGDLATLDIRDRATRTGMIQGRVQFAIQRGDFAAAQALLRDVRSQQEKEADKLTNGVLMEAILETRMKGGTLEEQRARLKDSLAKTYGPMPWAVVGDNLKSSKGNLELFSKNVMIGAVTTNMDPVAKNAGNVVPAQFVVGIAGQRNLFEHLVPFRDDAVAVLQALVDRNQVAKVDIWTERLVTLPEGAKGKPVVVGIWDSGTDVSLFKATAPAGIAFDDHMNPTTPLVRPMGEAASRLPQLKQYIKGVMDQRAAIDSPDAKALRARYTAMKPEEVKQFSEDMGAVGMWAHGTHVAGIAVEGNPFARVNAVAMHWTNSVVPLVPDEASAQRTAAAFKAAVASFRKAGARVVNMSWRYGPTGHESDLAYHNIGKSPEERKQIANKLFAIEKAALESAIAGAPEILFVAGAGNEDNSADFSQYIPAGLVLPNLMTAGAVDQSGTETSFSTFGKTVVVHANGFEVLSFLPGGERMKLSGTSMSSPQVANLAAKLFAMKPELTPMQVKELILQGAERNGRVNLINPKKTLALAGITY